MKSDDEIVGEFNSFLNGYLQASNVTKWRSYVREVYDAMAGTQWTEDAYKYRTEIQKKPVTTCNRMAPIINGLAGYEILNRNKIEISPRHDLPTQEEDAAADDMSDIVEYIQEESGFYFESSQLSKDALICGLGCSVTYFDYDDTFYGEVKVDRIFPGFALWDYTASKRNLKDATRAGYVEVVNRAWLDNEIKNIKGDGVRYNKDIATQTTNSVSRILFFIDNIELQDIDFIYHYEWFEREPTFNFRNPLVDQDLANMPELLESSDAFAKDTGVAMDELYLSLDNSTYRKFRNMLNAYRDMGGVDLAELIEPRKGTKKRFYKARIARGVILDKTESWANDFTIQFKTGYYDESQRYFYGPTRQMLPIQRLLNEAISDYQSYLQSVPKGGVYIEEDAVTDIADFLKNRMNEQNITILSRGGLGKMQPKEIPGSIPGLTDFIQITNQMLTAVIGIPQDFFGAVESGNMTDALLGRIVKQSYMVNADFFESNRVYLRRQGNLLVDASFVLVDNYDGLPIRKLTDGGSEVLNVYRDKLSRNYDIRVSERPVSDDEKMEQFQKLMEMSGILLNKPNPVDITPLLVSAYPYEHELKQQVLQLMQPPPPPEPDPTMQALLQAETEQKIADARKKAAEAQLAEARALAEMQDIQQGRLADREMDAAKLKLEQAKVMLEAKQVDIRLAETMIRAKEADARLSSDAMKEINNILNQGESSNGGNVSRPD